MNLVEKYYQYLTRTDHPVFTKDYSSDHDSTSQFNPVINLVIARQLARIKEKIDVVTSNTYPHSVTEENIPLWEDRYFGYKKPNVNLEDRREQLLLKFNSRISLAVKDIKDISESITGIRPIVVRNVFYNGWVFGESYLGVSTFFGGDTNMHATYVVIFQEPLPTEILNRLDTELTKLEKGGSRHFIDAPPEVWVLNESLLGINTIFGE